MNNCSVKEILARIFRNNRGIDSSYKDDILEWIAEAMSKLETSTTLYKASSILTVKQHVAKKPCDFVETIGLAFKGQRIHKSGEDSHFPQGVNSEMETTLGSVFIFDMSEPNKDSVIPNTPPNKEDFWKGTNIKQASQVQNRSLVYQENASWFTFTIESGQVDLIYYRREVDNEGFPLIPDNENYKTALYWYVIMMMIGSGYTHPNRDFNHSYCFQMYELYSSRALGQLKMPNPEDMQMLKEKYIRLLPVADAYDTFFRTSDNKENIYR